MAQLEKASDTLLARVKRISARVARPAAPAVDRDARFPHEAIAALREAKLLAAAIPRKFGGLGCSVTMVAAMCTALGRACASTATIFAMHQIQVASLARHGMGVPFLRDYLREAAKKQWLIASGTSEAGVGGDLRSSIAALERTGVQVQLRKDCSTLSYGRNADAILLTARRNPDAAPGDQVLVLLRKQDYQLEQLGAWDTLGMRGTCSPAFKVLGEGAEEQIVPEPFQTIASQTMVPYSHIVWAAAWLGIATDAVSIARELIRRDAKRRPGTMSFGGVRLVAAVEDLQVMSAYIREAAQEYEHLSERPGGARVLSTLSYALRINNLKLASSRLVARICCQCLEVCGLRGYANESEFSIGRQLRDALGARLMIANDRIASTNANLLLLAKEDFDSQP